MTINLGIIMDPIQSIKPYKDSSFAMLLAAQARDWTLWYMELSDLFWHKNHSFARMRRLRVKDRSQNWFAFESEIIIKPLSDLNIVLMRKDPPFNMEYIYATYLLEQAEKEGCLVVNQPQALRDLNEKMATTYFPDCIPPSLISRSQADFKAFLAEHGCIIIKPLDGMGGASIFKIEQGDENTNVILETLTDHGQRYALAQKYIPEIKQGDKRVLIVSGEVIPYALARIPADGDSRGNLAAGGQAQGQRLSDRDRWIAEQIAPWLKKRGVLFAGIDIIGDYLTEINITSPTCIRELDNLYGLDIAGQLMERLKEYL